jgi:hypothetical protein
MFSCSYFFIFLEIFIGKTWRSHFESTANFLIPFISISYCWRVYANLSCWGGISNL